MTARVIIEADGGSRGNPGPAAYGALIRDADSGAVIAARGEAIGVATNNVAEYRGLIAGLELVREHAPEAELEVRMDSKLVIEQMAGRWKIKHADMKPLALQAQRLVPPGVTWTWVPRADNKPADALVNAALDDQLAGGSGLITEAGGTSPVGPPVAGWSGPVSGEATTMYLLRHGVTEASERKAFSGSGGTDHALTPTGHEQARRAAAWLARRGGVHAVVSSPLLRTMETAAVVAEDLGLDVDVDEGLAEADFGDWDGYTFAEIQERWPAELAAWLGSSAVAPPGGESFDLVAKRVGTTRDRLLESHAGRSLVVVSHVTPIKLLTSAALGAPMSAVYRMELAPASLTTISWWPDGNASLRTFNLVPE